MLKHTLPLVQRALWLCSVLLLLASPTLAATITIDGTGDSQHLLRQLAEIFQKQNPGSQILVPNSVGSGGGIKLLLAGRSDLARVARPLKPKEQAEGLHYQIFAHSPVVFVANLPTPCLKSIDTSNVKDILTGKISSWGQLGNCEEHKIYVANREDGDSSRSILEEKLPILRQIDQPVGRTIYSTPETYDTLRHYPYSFGYLPKSLLKNDSLTVFDFEQVSASINNVQQGRYPLAVPLGIVWKDELSGVAKQFIEFLSSKEAQQVMLDLAAIPALNN